MTFTQAELDYLARRRLVTVGPAGALQNNPAAFRPNTEISIIG
jgi:hypothetical protein